MIHNMCLIQIFIFTVYELIKKVTMRHRIITELCSQNQRSAVVSPLIV